MKFPTPENGEVIEIPKAGKTIRLAAKSENGSITRFLFQNPVGMQCSTVNPDGEVDCIFIPDSTQQNQAWGCIKIDYWIDLLKIVFDQHVDSESKI